MRYPASEKLEIIRLVEQSHLPVRRTLAKLGIQPARPLTDRDEILDLPPAIAIETRLFRSADRALRSKMANTASTSQ
jgi:hypothetical protein